MALRSCRTPHPEPRGPRAVHRALFAAALGGLALLGAVLPVGAGPNPIADDPPPLSDADLGALVSELGDDRAAALDALAPYGPSIVPRVRAVLTERNGTAPTLEHQGYRALVDRIAREALHRAEAEEGSVRYHGQFRSLEPLGADGAVLLLGMFSSEDETLTIRRNAGTALGDIGGPAQVPALEELADDFLTELWVQEEAMFLLARFGDRERVDARIAALQEVVDRLPTAPTLPAILNAHGDLARLHYRIEEYDRAVTHYRAKERLLTELRDSVRKELQGPLQAEIDLLQYNLACSLSLAGRTDEAFAALDRSMESREITLDMVRTDGDLRSIRSDPRFAAWSERWTATIERERAEREKD